MSFVTGCSSEPELCWFLVPSQEAAIIATVSNGYTVMERRTPPSKRSAAHHRRGALHGAEHGKQQQQRRPGTAAATSQRGPPTGYFSAELALVFLFVAASLAFLPLVLPPLSPPPFLLLLVPVGLLAVLVALAFVPLDAQSHLVGSSRL